MRKTDDAVILQMLSEGKTQKEIAEYFDVSGAAICKRVKKLRVPESLERLTEKEQKFALAVAEGKGRTEAALDSYDCKTLDSARSMAYQLLQKPDVQTAVADLMQEEGLTRRYRVKKLKDHVDHPNPDTSLKALDQTWKLDNAYSETYIHVHASYGEMVEAHEIADEKIRKFEEKYRIEWGSDIEEGEVVEND